MKRIIVCSLLVSLSLMVWSQNKAINHRVNENWEQLESISDRIEALQLTTDYLRDVSTENLIDECLSYPYLINFYYYGGNKHAFDILVKEFNGFEELLQRKDIILPLTKKLEGFSQDLMSALWKDSATKGKVSFQYLILEYILAEECVISRIKDESANIIAVIEKNKKIMSTYDNIFGKSHYILLNSILFQLNQRSSFSSENNRAQSYIYTPKGTPVSVDVIDSELTQDEYNNIVYDHQLLYNQALIVGDATKKYNCHAYAWHVSEGGNEVWLNRPNESNYWLDGSYIEVPQNIATKVSYVGDHSATKIDSVFFISKWGKGFLLKHRPNYVPPGYGNPNRYYIRNNFSISGSTVICDSTLYSLENLPNTLNVSWSINNTHFTLSPNGTQCTVTFNDVPQYDEATLTATILKDTITVTTLSKRIVMQGTDMYIEGVQSGIYDENGDIPAVACTFTIPANNELRRIGNRLSTINRDSLEMTSLPVVFENMRTITIPDNPTYGITEIYGGADIYLDGERLDGMTISFSGDRAPEYLYSDGGTMIAFRMPEVSSITDVQGYYYVVLHATSEGGCHDFDLYFKVIPVEGESIGDSEISLYFTDYSVRVDFDAMEWEELPNGMLQPTPWYLRIFRMSTGAQMHYSVNNTESKTVDISSWPADVYIVRVDSGENRYTKKFLKQ